MQLILLTETIKRFVCQKYILDSVRILPYSVLEVGVCVCVCVCVWGGGGGGAIIDIKWYD